MGNPSDTPLRKKRVKDTVDENGFEITHNRPWEVEKKTVHRRNSGLICGLRGVNEGRL